MSIAKKLYFFIVSMRPKQWIKNGFVFAGLIFSRSFLSVKPVLTTFFAFILFSIISGGVYIINDVVDRKKDAMHPKKKTRPLASGKIKAGEALVFAAIVLGAGFCLSYILSISLFYILVTYFLMTLAYSLKLKNIVILDVIIIAMGFVLRTVGGAVAIQVTISPWLILCTTLLALFLALNKRKNELLVLSDDAAHHRKILEEYSPELIDQMLSVVTSTTVMSYALYTFNAGKSYYIMLTIPFVLYGIFRYQYLASTKDMGGSPEMALLKDKPLLIDVILWIITSIVIVWLFY
ncbi:MAG TPA: decaprenyl-phosphate phosphoribosyltransferase [Clostridiaceae bacterium]|nr:decaprenyl-phosphate phosphoribosyltransferase [Clostridiaceae bacterium]